FMSPEHLAAVIEERRNGEQPVTCDSATKVGGTRNGAGSANAIDARSDLYSLGVILYHLLTGHDPHDLATAGFPESMTELLKVRRTIPVRPSTWNKLVTPAVDAIVMKLLMPDPQARYARAADLQDDLERHLGNLPLRHAPNTSI